MQDEIQERWKCPRCGKCIVLNKLRITPPQCPRCGYYMLLKTEFSPRSKVM